RSVVNGVGNAANLAAHAGKPAVAHVHLERLVQARHWVQALFERSDSSVEHALRVLQGEGKLIHGGCRLLRELEAGDALDEPDKSGQPCDQAQPAQPPSPNPREEAANGSA